MGLPVESQPAGLAGAEPRSEVSGPLHGWSMIWTLAGIFFGGIALNLTPCVYPMIPITVSFFGIRNRLAHRRRGTGCGAESEILPQRAQRQAVKELQRWRFAHAAT